MADEDWETGAIRMAIIVGGVFVSLGVAVLAVNALVDVAIPIVGRKYIP